MSNKIIRIPVDSSMLTAIGYDPNQESLYVEFNNTGYIYEYHEVEPEVFEELKSASSIGSYMRNNILDCYGYSNHKRRFRW